jgi:hypothetical protein
MKSERVHFIFEGPDGVGKSTYINDMLDIFEDGRFNVYTYDKDDTNTYNFWKKEYDRMLSSNLTEIHSRSFLSERLYADIFGRAPRITKQEERALFNYIKDKVNIIVLMPAMYKLYIKRLNDRGDYDAVLDNIMLIVQRYKDLIEEYNLEVKYV